MGGEGEGGQGEKTNYYRKSESHSASGPRFVSGPHNNADTVIIVT